MLANGHAMTVAAAFWPRTFALPPVQERLFRVDAESQLLGHCHWQPGRRPEVPVVVIVHGLEGSSDSSYAKGIAEKVARRGFHAIRLNQRNCGGTEALTPLLYNSGMSADYRAVFQELAYQDRFQHIFFVGYSMGGNLVTKMAAEFGDAPPPALRGICAICPAIDLAACADALERRDNFFYQRHFVSGLMQRYARKSRLLPALYPPNGFGRIRTVRQFDDAITAPHAGYPSAQAYYEGASAKRLISQLRVPLLMIAAQDDPFIPYSSFAAANVAANPAIQFAAPTHGGHCAFISNKSGAERFWAEQRVADFCSAPPLT
ncbi:MAG: alpha/beta fold hydrolase [Candidatus Acidiferrum sp.]